MTGPRRVEFQVWRSEPEILEVARLKLLYPTQDVAKLFAMDLVALHEQAAAMNWVYGEDIGPIDTGKGRMGRLDLIRAMLEYRARFMRKAQERELGLRRTRRRRAGENGRR